MSDLYVEHEHGGHAGVAPIDWRKASRSDVLEWLGWEKCDECDGKGNKVRGGYRGDTVWMDCPNCLSGLVPPAHQVGEISRHLAKFMFDWADDAPYWPTDDLHIGDRRHDIRNDARAALIAAMEAVSDD